MPRETLTKDQIVRTAIDLLDDEGLDGLNMRSLGKRLGAAATAVYWHVKNKDDLVVLAGDQVWAEIDLPPEDADWRTAAREMARSLHAMLSRHPWLVQAFGTHLFHGPNKARYDDRALAVFEAAGFPGPEADRAAAAVLTFVLGNVLGASALITITRRIEREGDDARERLDAVIAQARATAAAFPRLRERLDSPAAEYNASPEHTFEYGLDALLDGLARR
ncbi:Tetracycline repressor protein class A from transposon 1721 [Actinosynnema sp. ALI-1.44]